MPFRERLENRLQIFNELVVYACQLILTNFLNSTNHKDDFEMVMGWVYIGAVVLNFSVNIAVVVVHTVWSIYKARKVASLDKQRAKRIKEALENKKKLIELEPKASEKLERQVKRQEAIDQVKQWHRVRLWLKQNNVDFSNYIEEVTFTKIVKEFKLEKLGYQQLLRERVTFALMDRTEELFLSQRVQRLKNE